MVSLHFVQKLIKKLKTGNNRSIHLHASPANYARLDWFDWSIIDSALHLRFLHLMLSKQQFNFNIKISPADVEKASNDDKETLRKIISRLDAMAYQYRDEYSEYGTKTFGLGYPMLIRKDLQDPEKHQIAPLLIWYFDIEKDNFTPYCWKISRNEEHPVVFNELLGNLIQNQEKFIFEKGDIPLDIDLLDEEKLSEFCKSFLSSLQFQATDIDTEVKIIPCPDKHTLPKLLEVAPCIRWSGVWGLYRHTKESIISDLEELIQKPELLSQLENEAIETGELDNRFVSPVALDPSQEKILQEFEKSKKIVVNGPPGTGKSQTITALIAREISKGNTCLIICEKKTAQDVILNNLQKVGLGSLCLQADDWVKSRREAVESVRSCADNLEEYVKEYKNHSYQNELSEFNQFRNRIDDCLSAYNLKVWGDASLAELICRLKEFDEKYPNNKTLNNNIQITDFQFNIENYLNIKSKITKAQSAYQNFSGKRDYFNHLPDSLFHNQSTDYLIQTIKPGLEKLFDITTELVTSYQNGIQYFGDLFLDNRKNRFYLRKVLSVFVPKFRMMSNFRIHYYEYLKKLSAESEILEKIGSSFNEKIELHNTVIHHDFVKALHELLSKTKEHIDCWENYLSWKKYLLEQDNLTRIILEAIAYSGEENWHESLEYLFYYKVFEQYTSEVISQKNFDSTFEELKSYENELRKLSVDKTLNEWLQTRVNLVKRRTIKATKLLYNFKKNQQYGSRNSLRKIIQHDPAFFSRFFPVLISNPTVSCSILPLLPEMYDTVIFDESSQLRLEDTFSSVIRGKKIVVSGDKHQMPPSNFFESTVFFNETEEDENQDSLSDDFLAESESLLDYAYDTDYKNYFLDFHYRSEHPDLIRVSNALFYGSRLMPLPPQSAYSPFGFYKVDGFYRKGTNKPEAEAIVQHLMEFYENENYQNASIGIATFNVNQRNLILDQISRACSENHAFAHQFNRWLELGFFVKNLENIQGEERDIFIVSTTFGKNDEGVFKQNFGPIIRQNGYKLLNVLFTRAKSNMLVFSSIPDEYYTSVSVDIKERGLTGKNVLYSFLNFIKLKSENRHEEADGFIRFLEMCSKERYYDPIKVSLSPFKQMIYKELQGFNHVKIKVHEPYGGILPDFTVYREGEFLGFVECCDSKFYSTPTGYRQVMFRKYLFQKFSMPFLLINPASWYLSDGKEALEIFLNK